MGLVGSDLRSATLPPNMAICTRGASKQRQGCVWAGRRRRTGQAQLHTGGQLRLGSWLRANAMYAHQSDARRSKAGPHAKPTVDSGPAVTCNAVYDCVASGPSSCLYRFARPSITAPAGASRLSALCLRPAVRERDTSKPFDFQHPGQHSTALPRRVQMDMPL